MKLDEKEILVEDPKLMKEVKELIAEYEEVFKLGRPMNPKMEQELRSQIDVWLAEGLIEESKSP